jgi:hypothetical protein
MPIEPILGFARLFGTLFSGIPKVLGKKQRWIAIATLIICVGLSAWGLYTLAFAASDIYSGIVRDQTNHQPIARADILVVQEQAVPEVLYTDDHGVFVVRIHPKTALLTINVNAKGYNPTTRSTSPVRTGPEEFELTPLTSPPITHAAKPPTKTPPPRKDGPQSKVGDTTQSIGNCVDTKGPCVAYNVGTINFNIQSDPPPVVRNVNPALVQDAIATLRTINGVRVRVDGVGGSSDLESFVGQIMTVFYKGGWSPYKGERILNYNSITNFGAGPSVSQGQGISCYAANPNIAFIGKRALQQIGYPCQSVYTPNDPRAGAADFYLMIGSP